MKSFKIPVEYRSNIISKIKIQKKKGENEYSPFKIDLGKVEFIIPSHFGFCFGVENALEIAYRTIESNPNKKIFLLSEMIHNPEVNKDLKEKGVSFIFDNKGKQLISWENISKDDIVIIPAFGSTTEIEEILTKKGLDYGNYNTTCPFVKRVWKRAAELGNNNATVIIHGKYDHEETKATFSHTKISSKTIIIRDNEEAQILCKIILGEIDESEFYKYFAGKFSEGFDVKKDLIKIGVVNQTTMLASDTEKLSKCLKNTLIKKYGEREIDNHFFNTRETLCYATSNNQTATENLLREEADLAFVVGGYNSSNTTHIAELLSQKFKIYFISSADKLVSDNEIHHYDFIDKKEIITKNFLPQNEKIKIIITSGASCPDSIIEKVLLKIIKLIDETIDLSLIEKKLNIEGN